MTNTKKLATSAMMVAMASALAVVSLIIPLQLPFGGGVTFASMLPICIVGYMYGTKWGLASAFVFSIIQAILGGQTVMSFFMPGDSQMIWWKAVIVCLLDYIIAYTVIGFSGVFANKFKNKSICLCIGSVFALALRYLCHILSGAIFFGVWAEWFFSEMGEFGAWVLANMSGPTLSWFYSVVYNGLYMIPEIVLTGILAYLFPIFFKNLKPHNEI